MLQIFSKRLNNQLYFHFCRSCRSCSKVSLNSEIKSNRTFSSQKWVNGQRHNLSAEHNKNWQSIVKSLCRTFSTDPNENEEKKTEHVNVGYIFNTILFLNISNSHN